MSVSYFLIPLLKKSFTLKLKIEVLCNGFALMIAPKQVNIFWILTLEGK